jgi:hypothetical protein
MDTCSNYAAKCRMEYVQINNTQNRVSKNFISNTKSNTTNKIGPKNPKPSYNTKKIIKMA